MRETMIGLLAVVVFAGCGQKARQEAAAMPGMVMKSDSLIPAMRAHVDSLSTQSSMAAALGTHDAQTSRLLDAMGADMTAMGMKPDAAWTALSDSVTRDLADLPALTGSARDARLKGHVDRLRRLMAMHQAMMHAK